MSQKIAFVTDTFPRWSERFIAREMNECRRLGVDFTVFALARGEGHGRPDPEWDALVTHTRTIPSALSTQSIARTISPSAHSGNQAFDDAAGRVHNALGLRGRALIARARILSDYLKQEAFTHVHAHFANVPSTLAWLATRATGLPFTFSAHAFDLFVEPQFLDEKARDAVAFFACHQNGYDRLRAIPGHGEKAILMRHGLPLDLLASFRGRLGPSADSPSPFKLIFAGRLTEKKGLPVLLEALKRTPPRDPPVHLTILGDGPDKASVEKSVEHGGGSHRIQMLPPVSGPELWNLFQTQDALVAPFITAGNQDQDGIPNVILEAFALELPVIGSDAGGLKEIVTEQTGWPTPSGEPDALARALTTCLDQPGMAKEKSKRALEMVEQAFDIRLNLGPLLDVVGV